MMHAIALAMGPILFVMGLGYLAGMRGIVSNAHVGTLNSLTMTFALPAALLATTAATPRDELTELAPVAGVLLVVLVISFLGWLWLERNVFRRSLGEAAIQAITVGLPNFAAAGVPILVALRGPSHTAPVAAAIAIGSTVLSPITLAILQMEQNTDTVTPRWRRIASAVGAALRKPIVLAPVAGVCLAVSGLPLPSVLDACLRQIGQTASGLALFLTGLILSAQRFQFSANIVWGTLVGNLVQPALAWAIGALIGLRPEALAMTVLLASLPSGFFGLLFGKAQGIESPSSGMLVLASTLTSIVTTGAVVAIFFGPPA